MKKSLYIILAVSLFLLACGVAFLPLIWDLRWLPGWPKFFVELLFAAFVVFTMLCSPWGTKSKRRWVQWTASAAAIIIWLGIAAWNGFGEGRVSEYIRSPGGTNTAVVIDNGAEVAFPLRARFFYECGREGKDVLQHESWTYEWIGENTLEFHVKMFDGEIVTERVNF